MATIEQVQTALGDDGHSIRIIRELAFVAGVPPDGLFRTTYYVYGGAEFHGAYRWIRCFTAHTAAGQASTIRATFADINSEGVAIGA